MSDLPTPITREEQFLNGIAQGDTNDLPSPVTREEKYLDHIARNGGGGGTTNYNALDNKPQIAGTTLQGDKSLADLGIASAEALTNKVDKVEGKGLSENDYDSTEKGKVADNTSAIEAIVNVYGAKNLLDLADKTLSASGYITQDDLKLPAGSYELTFDFSGTSNSSQLVIQDSNHSDLFSLVFNVVSGTNKVSFTLPTESALIVYFSNAVGDYSKFMIRDARITDPTYVPYAMTNEQLTKRVTQSEFVSVPTDGVKTQKQLMQDLYALVDSSKITMQSKLVLNNANSLSFYPLNEQALDNRFICFMRTAVSIAVGEVIETYQLGDNTAYAGKAYSGAEHDMSSEVLSAGMSFTVFY